MELAQKINRAQIQNLFDLQFIRDKENVILLGLVGVGKTHLATALGYSACQAAMSVLFANAMDVINTIADPELTSLAPQVTSALIDGKDTPDFSFRLADELDAERIKARDLLFSGQVDQSVELAEAAPLGGRRGWKSAYPVVQWSVSR